MSAPECGRGADRGWFPAVAAAVCLVLCVVVVFAASCAGPEHKTAAAPPSVRPSSTDAEPGEEVVTFTASEQQAILTLSPLPPLPRDPTNAVADDPRAARLGQFLFFDTRLSRDGKVSCASCHQPEKNWTDGERAPVKFGADLRHVPSLWNVAYNRWYFWDGRSDSLWSQALQPLENPAEHGVSRGQCVNVIRDDPALRKAYERVFGPMEPAAAVAAVNERADPQVDRTFANIGKAIAAYERRIVSGRAPFDEFAEGLRTGDAARMRAISPEAQRGLRLFIGAANCRSCHHGPNFTDGEFHDTGIASLHPLAAQDAGRMDGVTKLLTNPFNAMGAFNDDPQGRRDQPTAYLVNQVEFRGQFKTPSLRNVAVTPPYMHRGQLATLEEVVRFYSAPPTPPPPQVGVPMAGHRHRAGRGVEKVLTPLNLSEDQIQELVAFLETLTDVKIDPALLRKPPSP